MPSPFTSFSFLSRALLPPLVSLCFLPAFLTLDWVCENPKDVIPDFYYLVYWNNLWMTYSTRDRYCHGYLYHDR